MKKLTIDEAEELAMETDYAVFASEPKGNEINKADAGAFFLEGYNYAIKLFNKSHLPQVSKCAGIEREALLLAFVRWIKSNDRYLIDGDISIIDDFLIQQ